MTLKQKDFASLCGVKPPAISDLLKRNVLHAIDRKIDLSDALNLAYLAKHNTPAATEYQRTGTISGIVGSGRKTETTPKRSARQTMTKKLAEIRAEEIPETDVPFDPMAGLSSSGVKRRGQNDQDEGTALDGLTEAEIAETLRKPLYDARKAKMESEIKAVALDTLHHSLGEREDFDEMIQALWHAMQLNYIDVAPKQAALVCKRLGMAGHELEVIEVLEADIKKRQDNVAKSVDDVLNRRLSKIRKIDEVEE